MIRQLLDIAPWPDDHKRIPVIVRDTVDTVVDTVKQVVDTVPQDGGGGSKTTLIIGAIAAALLALGLILLMVRAVRHREEQRVSFQV
jgi:hypothetical protein